MLISFLLSQIYSHLGADLGHCHHAKEVQWKRLSICRFSHYWMLHIYIVSGKHSVKYLNNSLHCYYCMPSNTFNNSAQIYIEVAGPILSISKLYFV